MATTPQVVGKLSPPDMTQLSPSVFLYRPAPSLIGTVPSSPNLILIASWMDARDVHIYKYVARYQTHYPTACILLVKSFFRYYFSPGSARRDLAHAVDVIRDVVGNSAVTSLSINDKPAMLVHVFSNGGSCMLYYLYNLYAETATASPAPVTHNDNPRTASLLPPHVTIFDSAPGRWSYSGFTGAVLASLPVGWARTLAFPLVHLLGVWWVIKYRMLKVPEETHVWGLAHNDPALVREGCRAYIYSEADGFVDYRHVEEHANQAEINGYRIVHRDKFPHSRHVTHAHSDPNRYWFVVRNTWEARDHIDGRDGL